MPDLKTELMQKVLPTWLEPEEEQAAPAVPQTQTARLYAAVQQHPGLEASEYADTLKGHVSANNITSLLSQLKTRGYLSTRGTPMCWWPTSKVYAPSPERIKKALDLQARAVAAKAEKLKAKPAKPVKAKTKPAPKAPQVPVKPAPKGVEALISSWTPQYARQVYVALKELFG